jgi:DNA-binding transcriptional regulator YiaG
MDFQISPVLHSGENAPSSRATLNLSQRRLGQLLGITQRTIRVVFEHSKERFSPRKLIPVNPKTTGDHLLLKRIQANLSQPEVALNTGVSEKTVRAWEHDQLLPTQAQWQVLAGILHLDSTFQKR